MTETALTAAAAPESRVSDYVALLKPGVMSLVVFSGIAGMWVAPGVWHLPPVLLFTAILCLTLGAGAAGAANMWYERDIDAIMRRTQGRPLPQGRISPDEAKMFALVLSFFSVITMGLALNWTAAALLALANAFYVVIYTVWLKRRTPQNIVIGGAAGAFPPLIGWVAVTGHVAVFPLLLFALIFLWTPPHFWALSLFMSDDYERAGIPMLPAARGARHTKIQMLVYTLLLLPVAVAPTLLGYADRLYGGIAVALSLFFVFTALRTLRDTGLKSAKLMFGYSVFYLFAIFLALMVC